MSVSSLYSVEDTKGWDVHAPVKGNRHILNVSENLTGRNKRDDYKEYSCKLYIYIYIYKNAQNNVLLSLSLDTRVLMTAGYTDRRCARNWNRKQCRVRSVSAVSSLLVRGQPWPTSSRFWASK